MPSVHILTLGCPKNAVASNRLKRSLSALDFSMVEDTASADAVIVNTCGFIEAAKRESIDTLLEIAALNTRPAGQKLIAVGCLAERYSAELAKALPEVDRVLGFDQLGELPKILGAGAKTVDLDFQAPPDGPSAYLEIADGCDHKCSFCAIPSFRGPFRSRQPKDVLAEARHLAQSGCQELVLVSQDTGAYGSDLRGADDLAGLLSGLSGIDGVRWIRLLYLQWQYLNDALIEAVSTNDKICLYLDMPLQHASPRVLKAMNRLGGETEYLRLLDKLREQAPDVALRTSIIAGFPGETAGDVEILARFLRRVRFDYVGLFEYSAEEGTVASTLKNQVEDEIKRERAAQLRALADRIGAERRTRFADRVIDVLVEATEGDSTLGRTQFQAPDIDGEVRIDGRHYEIGRIVSVRITGFDGYDLKGEPADAQSGK
jgi:ribosomal protein S12 methylthiotransferase